MSLSILIPTLGVGARPSLAKLLDAIAEQTVAGDEVIVASDTALIDSPTLELVTARELKGQRWGYTYAGPGAPLGGYGHALRNRVLNNRSVTGTHLWTIDDDDMILPGALALIRDACCERPVFFKMKFGPGSLVFGIVVHRGRGLMLGEVGTPQVAAPICKARFGNHYSGDFDYARALVEELGDPIWREEVIVEVRP